MARRIAISVGHGLHIRGASASPNPEPYNDEVNECQKIVDRVHEILIEHGHECGKFFDTVSTSQSENLNRIVNWHNAQSRDLDVSCHLNASSQTSNPMGCEVLFVTQETLAEKVSAAIAGAGHFKDRGEKYRGDLAFLNGTSKPAILLECWFCDSSADCGNGRQYREQICQAIAETIADVELDEIPDQPPIEPPVEPPEMSGDNRVDVATKVQGDVSMYLNGVMVRGHAGCEHVVYADVKITGDATLVINGEEFHNPVPAIPSNQTNITATVFGGSGDPNNSAYAPFGPLNDTELYVALPHKIAGELPQIKVINRATGQSAIARIADVGPWVTDDEAYVIGDERPVVEAYYTNKQPLPSGPNQGVVPSSDAAIDLSPALARAIGIDGKGKIDWQVVTVA